MEWRQVSLGQLIGNEPSLAGQLGSGLQGCGNLPIWLQSFPRHCCKEAALPWSPHCRRLLHHHSLNHHASRRPHCRSPLCLQAEVALPVALPQSFHALIHRSYEQFVSPSSVLAAFSYPSSFWPFLPSSIFAAHNLRGCSSWLHRLHLIQSGFARLLHHRHRSEEPGLLLWEEVECS